MKPFLCDYIHTQAYQVTKCRRKARWRKEKRKKGDFVSFFLPVSSFSSSIHIIIYITFIFILDYVVSHEIWIGSPVGIEAKKILDPKWWPYWIVSTLKSPGIGSISTPHMTAESHWGAGAKRHLWGPQSRCDNPAPWEWWSAASGDRWPMGMDVYSRAHPSHGFLPPWSVLIHLAGWYSMTIVS